MIEADRSSAHWCNLHERLAAHSAESGGPNDLAGALARALVDAGLCDYVGMWFQQDGCWHGAAFPDDGTLSAEAVAALGSDEVWPEPHSYVLALDSHCRLWLKWRDVPGTYHREGLRVTRPVLKMCLRELHRRGHRRRGPITAVEVAQLGARLASSSQLEQLLHQILDVFVDLTAAAGGEIEIKAPHVRHLRSGDTGAPHRLDVPFPHSDASVRLYFSVGSPVQSQQLELLEAFSSQACRALENVLAHEKEQDFAREALALYRAAREIEEGLDLEDVLERSAAALCQVASVDRCVILLKDQVRPVFTVSSVRGLTTEQEESLTGFRLPLSALTDRLRVDLEAGRALSCTGSEPSSVGGGLESLVALVEGNQRLVLPLTVKERLMGLIYLDSSRPGFAFSESVQRLVQTLVLQVANAIQRASLLHQLQENLGPLKALYQVSTAITGTLSLNKVVKLIVEQTAELLDHSACALLVLDEIGEGFRLETSLGLNEELLEPALQAKIARTAVERKRATALYVDKDPECEELAPVLSRAGFGGLLSVPLIARKKMVGVLNCFVPDQIRFRQQEIRFLKGFANQAAIAVENARLHGLVRFKMGELGTLFEVSKAVTSSLQLDRVLSEIVRHVRDILRADACSLMLLEGSSLVLRTVEGLPESYRCKPIPVGQGVAGIAAKMATPMILLDQDLVSSDFPDSLRQVGLRAILCVPIENRGRVLGLVNVYYKELMTPAPAQINLLNALGSQAAVAIENARLFAEKEKVTDLLRKALIPKDRLELPGVQIGHRFIPSMDLSGDYYEVIPLSPTKLVFVIADVSGKGPEAAIQTLRAKHILRSHAFAGYGPAECLRLLNQQIGREDQARHLSLFCAEADLTTRTLRFASAGHEPPIYWHPNWDEPQFLAADGILIGALPDATYEERQVPVPPDSWLILYTDGVTEARDPSAELFGMERILQSMLEMKAQVTPQKFVNNLYTRVRKFTRENITDDFSVMAIRF